MARQAKIYFQDQLAGILVEGDNGYSFYYDDVKFLWLRA